MKAHESVEVTHNSAGHRFEAAVADGQRAVLEYSEGPGNITFLHTAVPPSAGGRGIGKLLARAGLDYAKSNGLAVTPLCSFIAVYIEQHPEYQHLVTEKN